MSDNPIISLGELTKPATVLIEKISGAVGGVLKPYQIVRVAKAEAEADQIRAEAQIQVTDLHRRAMHRFLEEEAKRQSNIESITQKALPLLSDNSAPENVADDWITNFFDKSRIVSDEEMQRLWAGVLAGEANTPGTFSKRTVIADLDKTDALLFTQLCGFGWTIVQVVPLVFNVDNEVCKKQGIDFISLTHLDTLGLVRFDPIAGFRRVGYPQKAVVYYYSRLLELTFKNESKNELKLGQVLFTNAGQQLAPICGSKPIEGFFEFVCERWPQESPALEKVIPMNDPQ